MDKVGRCEDKLSLTMYRYLYPKRETPMARITYSQLRKNFSFYMNAVCDNGAPLFVSRRNARGVVFMSEDNFAGLMETVHLLASPANAARLLRSIGEAGPPK